MQQAKLSDLSDDEIMAELERKNAAMRPPNAPIRVAWQATVLCAVTYVMIIAFLLINAWFKRNPSTTWWMLLALVPLISGLPSVFFRIAREQQQLEMQLRGLRERVEVLEKGTTGHRGTPG